MAKLNYATEYLQTLEQMFPYVLYFGDLFATPNNGRFRWVNSRVIEVPTISTTGRTDGDRDTIGTRKRNYNNEWKPLTLENHRQWQTLVHPRDIAETKGVVAIGNITKVYNEEQKFPEMNAYCISKLYADWTTDGAKTAHSEVLTEENVLTVFDEMMKDMDNKRVPRAGMMSRSFTGEFSMTMKIFLEQRKSSSKESLPFCVTASRDQRFITTSRSRRMCRI